MKNEDTCQYHRCRTEGDVLLRSLSFCDRHAGVVLRSVAPGYDLAPAVRDAIAGGVRKNTRESVHPGLGPVTP